jgi:cytidine deaminase
MDSNTRMALLRATVGVQQRAYARYSQFQVGAALLGVSGDIFTGCNVENASYGLTICAERAAVFSAVAAGQQRFLMLAIAARGGATPCGACRQVLVEFAPDLPIMLINSDDPMHPTEANLRDLLPGAFTFSPPQPPA